MKAPNPRLLGKYLILGIIIGGAIGILLAKCVADTQIREYISANSVLSTLCDLLIMPAMAATYLWSMLGLPPGGDQWPKIAKAFIVVEWTILGSIAGAIFAAFRGRHQP
jgi:hypothetical protein